uniref:Glycine N-acyltransferase-like protein n=1 Tax=Terrapene triunguis TaxID=2587831 RepID=A0A674JUF9_9SAUR
PPCLWQVYGTVKTINRGNLTAQEVLVDSWPEFKVVLTRSPVLAVLYYRDLGAYQALLGSAGAVNWGQNFRILGNLYPKASGRAPQQLNIYVLSGGVQLSRETSNHSVIFLKNLMILWPSHDSEVLSSLDVSHADLLNETWQLGGNEKSRKYLASLIRHFPSVCLLDAAGHPVSWIASYPFGAMGPGYTLPQHRRRGYMGMLNNLIAKQLHALGYPSYGYVAMENYPMQSPTGLALPHSPIPTFKGSVLLSQAHNLPSLMDLTTPDPYTQHSHPTS